MLYKKSTLIIAERDVDFLYNDEVFPLIDLRNLDESKIEEELIKYLYNYIVILSPNEDIMHLLNMSKLPYTEIYIQDSNEYNKTLERFSMNVVFIITKKTFSILNYLHRFQEYSEFVSGYNYGAFIQKHRQE